MSFYSAKNFSKWFESNHVVTNTYLIDYDLGQNQQDALALVTEHKLINATILTGHFDDMNLRERCRNLGLKILPKPLASLCLLRTLDRAKK